DRWGERDAVQQGQGRGVVFDGHGPALVLAHARRAGEERGGVAVIAQAEQDQVETRQRLAVEGRAQLVLVFARGVFGRKLAVHTVDVCIRNGNVLEQRVARGAVVALR